jgi:hypothetical protein
MKNKAHSRRGKGFTFHFSSSNTGIHTQTSLSGDPLLVLLIAAKREYNETEKGTK